MAFGREKGNLCPAGRDVPLPCGLLKTALQLFIGDGDAHEVSEVVAIETESYWIHSEIYFCQVHVPVLPLASVLDLVDFGDREMKLVKVKWADMDADNPGDPVPDLVEDACDSEVGEQDVELSRAPEVFPGAWVQAESNPKLRALIENDENHRAYHATMKGGW